jgi:hypothetical protein
MSKKILIITVSCMFLLSMAHAPASAACRDDCYRSCCGNNSMCNGPGMASCLSGCLKGCGGDNVPPVPAPTPADDKNKKDDQSKKDDKGTKK